MDTPISALYAFRSVVGPEHVITDPQVLVEYEQATFATNQRVPLVILPASTDQVQAPAEEFLIFG